MEKNGTKNQKSGQNRPFAAEKTKETNDADKREGIQ
jgi:hypothetical protein